MKSLMKLVPIAVLAATTAACEVSPEMMEALNTPPMARGALVDSAEMRRFEFPKMDADGKAITRADVFDALEQGFLSASEFSATRTGQPSDCVSNRPATPRMVQGLMVGADDALERQFNRDQPSILEARYQNYTQYSGARTVQGSSINVEYAVDLEDQGNSYVASVRPWRLAEEKASVKMDPYCGMINPLGTVEDLQADADNSVLTMNAAIIRRRGVEGEVDTPFPADAVKASFERLWQPLDSKEAVEQIGSKLAELPKDGASYSIELNDLNHPIHVTVYPYRDGSKVTYFAQYGYRLTPDNSSDFSEASIKAIEDEISRVALD